MTTYRDPWEKKAKWLMQALIISSTLNVGLISTFIYFALADTKDPTVASRGGSSISKMKETASLKETLLHYSTLSYQDLLILLSNTDHVQLGCTKRDLALSCLVAFHHFNLERSLGGASLSKREISFETKEGQIKNLTLFPGLADYQYQAIVYYAKTERWPLTSYGIFLELQKEKPPLDPTLLDAFYLTPEFHFSSLLFSKTGIALKKEYLAALLAQCPWEVLSETTEHLRLNAEFTVEERRHFLLRLIAKDSKIAAKILLEADGEYCLKYLDNDQVLGLGQLLKDKTPPAFLKALLESPRSDAIWKMAATILYDQAAEELPETLDLQKAKQRFINLKAPDTKAVKAPPKHADRSYVVKAGDSLWRIARDQKTTIQELRRVNNLNSDRLQIGQTLVVP